MNFQKFSTKKIESNLDPIFLFSKRRSKTRQNRQKGFDCGETQGVPKDLEIGWLYEVVKSEPG